MVNHVLYSIRAGRRARSAQAAADSTAAAKRFVVAVPGRPQFCVNVASCMEVCGLVRRNPRVQNGMKSVLSPKHRQASSAIGATAMVQRWKWSEKRLRTKARGNSTGFVRSRKMVPQPPFVHSASIAASFVGTVLTRRNGKPCRIECSCMARASSRTSSLLEPCKMIGRFHRMAASAESTSCLRRYHNTP